MSMIGKRMMYQIERRCSEIFPNIKELFGGICVYLIGDFRQLPPVLDSGFYSVQKDDRVTSHGAMAFKSFQSFIELNQCHRQNPEDVEFLNLLDNIANASVNVNHYNSIISRRVNIINSEELKEFDSAISLYPTNAKTIKKNNDILRKSKHPVARIMAINNPNIIKKKDDITNGLSNELCLSEGCRIMLRSNLFIRGRLVNGSLGTIRKIIYEKNACPPQLPLYVLVQFDDYKGPYIKDDQFPIVPIIRSWTENGIKYTRKQLPITVAHAITIHKSQGLTLDKIIIDVGEQETTLGTTYVAMSRVRKLKDMIFEKIYTPNRFIEIGKKDCHKPRLSFLEKLRHSSYFDS